MGEPRATRVFVYGTLQAGERNHGLMAGARFLGAARSEPRYELLDLGTHPALLEGGSSSVEGELYALDAAGLARLDRFESEDDDYARRELALLGGQRAFAWFAPQRARGAPAIASGSWRVRQAQRARALAAIAVDWSGAASAREQRRKIWLAEARGGRLERLEAGRTRAELVRELAQRCAREPELAIGLDFCFSLPAWHARALGCANAFELWQLVAREGEGWLARPAAPFWRAHAPAAAPERSPFRRTEGEGLASAGDRPLSIYQLVGAQVGTGSLRGMPSLLELRAAGAAIWPFDEPRLPLVLELYPRVFTGPVVKRNAAARALVLERVDAKALPRELRARAEQSDDAFDAALSALGLSLAADSLVRLPGARDEQERLEGRILRPACAQALPWIGAP